jgi:hypothetical protein
MDDDFASPNLSIAIRADDQADVFLNGTPIWSLPEGTFNDAIAPGMSFVNPALFNVGRNCLDVAVKQIHGAVTGFNLVGTITADDGLCCHCWADILDDAATGIDDLTTGPITSGLDDDEWMVTASASGGVLPRPATVIDKYVGWDLIPFTKWITADATGPAGLYTYEKCWCMNPSFQNAVVSLTLLADDRASVYLNGSLIGSTPLSGAYLFPPTSITTANQSLFRAGENCVTIDVHNAGPFATGLDVAMSISATNAECCPCAELPPDAEGWWPLDETVGITAAELLHGHDGTWVGGPFPMPGKVLGSLDLDGTNDHVAVPDDPGLDFDAAQDFSFDAWIKTGTNTREVILQKRKPGSPLEPGYSFMTAGVLTLEIADGTHVHTCNGTINVADNEWHFVAATAKRDLSRIRLYVDSAMQTCFSTTMIGSLDNAEQLYFGADPLAAPIARKWWNGQLDEIEIFRRELDPAEVEAIHLADHAGKCRPEPCEDSTGIPICAGTCQPGLTCVAGSPPAGPCQCVQVAATCEGSAPQCNGSCPDSDDVCVGNGPTCHCEPAPQVACGSSPYPVCNGACPANQQCMQAPNQTCACFTCSTGVPSDPVVVKMAPAAPLDARDVRAGLQRVPRRRLRAPRPECRRPGGRLRELLGRRHHRHGRYRGPLPFGRGPLVPRHRRELLGRGIARGEQRRSAETAHERLSLSYARVTDSPPSASGTARTRSVARCRLSVP